MVLSFVVLLDSVDDVGVPPHCVPFFYAPDGNFGAKEVPVPPVCVYVCMYICIVYLHLCMCTYVCQVPPHCVPFFYAPDGNFGAKKVPVPPVCVYVCECMYCIFTCMYWYVYVHVCQVPPHFAAVSTRQMTRNMKLLARRRFVCHLCIYIRHTLTHTYLLVTSIMLPPPLFL